MKFRTDFVTNSSSSSFIMAFTSEDTMETEAQMGIPCAYEGSLLMKTFLKDIKTAERLSVDKVRSIAESKLYYPTLWSMQDEYVHGLKGKPKMSHSDFFKWEESGAQDFKDELNQRISSAVGNVMKLLGDAGVIISVEYGDHSDIGARLEHEILPTHHHTVYRFSHH